MSDRWYCTVHAAGDNSLVPAASVAGGRSLCPGHAGEVDPTTTPLRPAGRVTDCRWCARTPHAAFFVVDDLPLCIRHAADAMFPDDDMEAHAMAHAAYLTLGAAGVRDAY